MKRVYVAGKYDDKDIISILNNMRLGIRTCTELLLKGFAPFCPWLDYHFALMLRDNEKLDRESYLKYSMTWLGVSDCVLTLPNWEKSVGALDEIEKAKKLGIRVYHKINEIK